MWQTVPDSRGGGDRESSVTVRRAYGAQSETVTRPNADNVDGQEDQMNPFTP